MIEFFDIENNIYGLIKIVVACFAFIAIIVKIREVFSDKTRRQNLKLDLEIFKLSESIGSFEQKLLKNKIDSELEKIYDEESIQKGGLIGFLIGIIVFVGFSIWTLNLFNNSDSFNPWSILTMFISATGIAQIIGPESTIKSEGEFLRIEFHDRTNFIWGTIIGLVSFITLIALIVKLNNFSFWMILFGLLSLLGLISFIKNIKFKKVTKYNNT